ncbi:hypothetical protein [Azohydromonas sediminis]|uniref:hypothetical protein n=1 Tax=Azohydromonas sediminis TaxID=2259674 RepID=UPI000E65E066|nr:hypothetical protein [Azohydromonas sediminis]
MYEIWLVMNIVWEIALDLWPLLLGAGVLWVALMVTALRRRGANWRGGVKFALGAAVLAAVATVLWLPGATQASLADMAYWVDWANLLALAAGFGLVAAAFAWPLGAMAGSRRAAP